MQATESRGAFRSPAHPQCTPEPPWPERFPGAGLMAGKAVALCERYMETPNHVYFKALKLLLGIKAEDSDRRTWYSSTSGSTGITRGGGGLGSRLLVGRRPVALLRSACQLEFQIVGFGMETRRC